jgi:hypothetical protein
VLRILGISFSVLLALGALLLGQGGCWALPLTLNTWFPTKNRGDISRPGSQKGRNGGFNKMDLNVTLLITIIFVFVIAFIFSMFGQGGGSVYSPLPAADSSCIPGIAFDFHIPGIEPDNLSICGLHFVP